MKIKNIFLYEQHVNYIQMVSYNNKVSILSIILLTKIDNL